TGRLSSMSLGADHEQPQRKRALVRAIHWWRSPIPTNPLDRSAWDFGRMSAKDGYKVFGLPFAVVLAVLVGLALPQALLLRAILIVLLSIIGSLIVVPLGWTAVVATLVAPIRQRDEARQTVRSERDLHQILSETWQTERERRNDESAQKLRNIELERDEALARNTPKVRVRW